jgi:DNA-directed RNA polymerase specialized sigma24 family protein
VKLFRRTAAALLAIWALAAVGILVSRATAPTPEKLKAFVESHPVAGLDPGQRATILEKAAAQLNSLSFDQRRELRESGTVREFFVGLTPAERGRFLDLTLPEGFRQMMSALNKMTPEKRQKLVQRALDDIRKNTPQSAERINEDEVKKVVAQGVSSFYEEANADVKLDFAPVLEELQRNLQSPR